MFGHFFLAGGEFASPASPVASGSGDPAA